jgi:23S rRNA pseudouridine2605 synthase
LNTNGNGLALSRREHLDEHSSEQTSPWHAYRSSGGVWRPPRREGLARVLAKAGYGARPRALALVQAGRITVDGHVVRDGGHAVSPQSDIRLDGEILREAVRQYIVMNKPSGIACQQNTNYEHSVINYLPGDMVGLEPAGRLATRARGLVVMSNDLWWNTRVTQNRRLQRGYEVLVSARIGESEFGVLSAGMSLPGHGFFKADAVCLISEQEQGFLVSLKTTGGHDRHIRSAFKALRHEVVRLTRVSLGSVILDGLISGRFRTLSDQEVLSLAGVRG